MGYQRHSDLFKSHKYTYSSYFSHRVFRGIQAYNYIDLKKIRLRGSVMSVFNRLPTEGYTQGGKFWVRECRDQELEGAKNTRL
jgi:hypothetical protein